MFISVHICKYVDKYNFNFLKVKEKRPRNPDEVIPEPDDLDESTINERRDFHVFSFNIDTKGN
jgi:hypothetical protein